jgi:hypothetical protein
MLQYPLINGDRHSFASVEIQFNNLSIGGFTAINYEALLDGQPVRGAGPLVIGHTIGLASWTGDFEMLLEEWNFFQASLGPGFMQQYFNIRVTYAARGMSTIVDTLSGCRVKSVGASGQSSSGDALVRKVPLLITSGNFNGVSPFPNQPSLSLGNLGGALIDGARRLVGI